MANRNEENKALQKKLAGLTPGTPEYIRVQNRINFNNSQIKKGGSASGDGKHGGNGTFKGVAQDFKGAADIAAKFGLTTPTTKLDTSQFEHYADPNDPMYAGKRTDEMKDILSKMQGGLAGLNSTENQAIREQATQEIQRNSMQEMERLASTMGKNRIRGAASNRLYENVEANKRNAIGDFEQKNLVDNIAIQDQRRNAYYNSLTGAETNEYDRGHTALKDLNTVNTVNLGQEDKDKAGYLAALTGVLGYSTAKTGQNQAYNLAKAGLPGSGGRPGKGDGKTNSGDGKNPNSGLDAYLNSLGNLYSSTYGKPIPTI